MEDKKEKRIAIGIPTYGTIKTRTVHSLFKLLKHLPYDWGLLTQLGSYIQDNRESIVKMARSLKFSHLLFVDHDMVFEPEVIQRLIDYQKEIIGVDFNMKKLPLGSTMKYEDPDGTHIKVEHENGLVECCAVATGLMLIDLKVFEKIPHPWFAVTADKEGNLEYGEDMWFCHQARKAGFKIWCDLTAKIKHIGDHEF